MKIHRRWREWPEVQKLACYHSLEMPQATSATTTAKLSPPLGNQHIPYGFAYNRSSCDSYSKKVFVFTSPLPNLSQNCVIRAVIYVFKKRALFSRCCHGTATAGNEQNTHIIIVDRIQLQFYQV